MEHPMRIEFDKARRAECERFDLVVVSPKEEESRIAADLAEPPLPPVPKHNRIAGASVCVHVSDGAWNGLFGHPEPASVARSAGPYDERCMFDRKL
jgi:hypothetical protein